MRARFYAINGDVEPVLSVLSQKGYPTFSVKSLEEVPSSGILIFTNEDVENESYSRGGTFFHRASHRFDGRLAQITPFLVRFKPKPLENQSKNKEFRIAVDRMAKSFDLLLKQDIENENPPWFSGNHDYVSTLGGDNVEQTKSRFRNWVSRARENFPESKDPLIDAIHSRCEVHGRSNPRLEEIEQLVTVFCPALLSSNPSLDYSRIKRLIEDLRFLNKAVERQLQVKAYVPTSRVAEPEAWRHIVAPGHWSDPDLEDKLAKGRTFLEDKVIPALEKGANVNFLVDPMEESIDDSLLKEGYELFKSREAIRVVNEFIDELKGEGGTKFHLYDGEDLEEYAYRSLSLYYADYMRFASQESSIALLGLESGKIGWNSVWEFLDKLKSPEGFEIFWLPRNRRQHFYE